MIDFSLVTDIMLGNETVTQIEDSLGNVLWSSAPPTPYFYVEDTAGLGGNELHIDTMNYSDVPFEIFCSTDQENWTSMGYTDGSTLTANIPDYSKLYLKANANTWQNIKIFCYDTYNVGGNVMSLLVGDNYEGALLDTNVFYQFNSLFQNSTTLQDASDLILPNNTTDGCYSNMFQGCTALTTAPALPATTLTYLCYAGMFISCTSLTTAPALPATTLADNCYEVMFYGCTSLTTAPALPATTLEQSCYNRMFYNCTALNEVTVYADDISAQYCLSNWLNNVAATGDFYNLGGATYPSGVDGIPTGWTEHTPSVPINVTIINTDSYTGATYQIDSETAQPVNVTGNTTFTVPTTATTLTVNRNGKGETVFTGVSGMTEDNNWTTAIPVQDMSSNVTIEFMSLI